MVTDHNTMHFWHQQDPGAHLIEAEKKLLDTILPKLHGYHLLFLGEPELQRLTKASLISHQVLVFPKPAFDSDNQSLIQSDLNTLPVLNNSVDVVMLSHLLEHVAHPHEVLRETHRILIPEGHVVITGFNPMSFWGAWHAVKKLRGQLPQQGKMLTINRIKDWLALLNFQIITSKMFYFRPPFICSGNSRNALWLEKSGEKYWPFWGGAYVIVAVKRVIPLTPVRQKFQLKKRLWQAAGETLPKPTTTSTFSKEK